MDQPQKLSLDYLNSLPDDLLQEILFQTDDLETLAKWCKTSERVDIICQGKFFWRMKYLRNFGNAVLVEGVTWEELYKQRIQIGVNSPISSSLHSYGIIDRNGNLHMAGSYTVSGIDDTGKMGYFSYGLHLVKFPSKVTSVSVGLSLAGAVTSDGKAYLWGEHDVIETGFVSTPKLIDIRIKAIKIEVGKLGYLVLLRDSSVYLNIYKENKIDVDGSWGSGTIDISIGSNLYAIITKNNEAFLGGDIFEEPNNENELIPLKLPEPAKHVIVRYSHIMILSTTGSVYMFDGVNNKSGSMLRDMEPELIKLPEPTASISTDGVTFAALSVTGKLYMWGDNDHNKISSDNQSFLSDFGREFAVKPVEISFGLPINYVSVGGDFTIAVSNDGMVNYWGNPERTPE